MLASHGAKQARREGGVRGLATPVPATFGGPPSARNIKYARMYHFEKKIQQFSSQRGPVKMFGGPTRMFPPLCSRRVWCKEQLLLRQADKLSFYVKW